MTIKQVWISAVAGFAATLIVGFSVDILGVILPTAVGVSLGAVTYLGVSYVTFNVLETMNNKRTAREFTAMTDAFARKPYPSHDLGG
jgi:hypothetical protein